MVAEPSDSPRGLLPSLGGDDGRDGVVRVGEDALRWSELADRADAVADRIRGLDALAVTGTASLDTIVHVVAGLRAGVPVVPVPADAGAAELAHILGDSGAVTVAEAERGVTRSGALAAAGERRPALVMYTSGTTGPPKGVAISTAALAAGLDGLADAWGWTPDDHLAHGLPLFHVHGLVLGVLGPLRVGSDLTHTVRPTAAAYAGAVGGGASMCFGVPTVWGRVVADLDAARALARARLLVSGSAALPTPVFDALVAATGSAPVERYGMTETLITLSTRHDGDRRPGSVGLPIAGVEARVCDDDGGPVPADGATIGALQVRGATLFDGYLGLPEATSAARTADGWFRTGDAATVDADGMHRIAGRASIDIIKSGGFKVGAGEIESVLLARPEVAEVAVIGVPDDDLGQRIVAYVVGATATRDPGADDRLISAVADALSHHKRPREIRWTDALPRNALGKVQKHQLG